MISLERRRGAPLRLDGRGGDRQAAALADLPRDEREAYDERRRILLEAPEAVKVMRVESELQRRDGSVFPAEATISRVRIGDEVVLTAFIRDIERAAPRRAGARGSSLREQAARAEAERVAEMVSGMQLLVDAALAHRTLGAILDDLVVRVRAVLDADAATIFLAEERARLVIAASSGGRAGGRAAGADRVRASASPAASRPRRRRSSRTTPIPRTLADPGLRELELVSLIGVPLMAEGEVTGVLEVGATAPHALPRGGPGPAAAGGRPGGARDLPRARLRARAPDRRDAPAQPAARAAAEASRASTWRRATCRRPPRPRSAATGTT